MLKSFYGVSEKKSSQDIRDIIYTLIKKYLKDVSEEIIQSIYIDLILVFFDIRPACICFPLEIENVAFSFISELISSLPHIGFIQNTSLKSIQFLPIVVFNIKHTSMIKDSIKTLEKLSLQQVVKYRSILSKMLGYSCISGINNKYLNYRVLFSFTFNPESQQQRPLNITTKHLVCWCDELDGFSLKNLVSKLEAIEIAFSVYGYLKPVLKTTTYTPKVARVPEYNVHLQIDMVQENI